MSPQSHGIGAQRRVHFYDGSLPMQEEISDLQDISDVEKSVTIRVFEFGSYPMSHLELKLSCEKMSETCTIVRNTVNFNMKYLFIGKILAELFLKRMMLTPTLCDILMGLEIHMRTGKEMIEGTRPTKEDKERVHIKVKQNNLN